MKKSLLRIALLSASLLVGIGPAINANIPTMAAHFNDIPLSLVEMLSTVPSLFLMISVFTSSFIAKRFGYKQTVVFGLGIVMISGILPLFIDNFYLILISRAFLGFGIGLFNSLSVSMINYFYEDHSSRSKMYGLQSAFEGIGGISITFIAGQLIKISWQAAFYAYLIGVPVFFIYLFVVPKTNTEDVLLANTSRKETGSSNHYGSVLFYVFILFVCASLYMTYGIKIAFLITSLNYGGGSEASLVIIALSLGGIITGIFFGKILNTFKSYTSSFGLLLISISMLIIAFSNNLPQTLLGGLISGMGFKTFMPSLIDKVNNSNIANKSIATSLILIGFNLGSFLSPYASIIYQNISFTNTLQSLFITLSIGQLILSIIMLFSSFAKAKTI